MKCDELKYERLGDAFNDYPDSTLVIRKQFVDAAIAELKAKLYEAEEARYEAGADAADYYQENRRLKRALWLARAYRGYDNSILLPSKFMRKVWDYVERKCRAKAEEYK